MTLDLWERSSEDVRERWRDIARTLRESGDAEMMPRALQTAFWFGADAARRSTLPRFDATLRSLLPPDTIQTIVAIGRGRSPAAATSAAPSTARKGR